jgi:hypothetical protein
MPSCSGLKRHEEALAVSEQISAPDPTFAVALVSKTEMPPALVCEAEAAPLRLRQVGLEDGKLREPMPAPGVILSSGLPHVPSVTYAVASQQEKGVVCRAAGWTLTGASQL